MCLILFAKNAHPKYKLVLASNRDEFLNRPTSPSHFWTEHPQILAGKDEVGGGTWLGITKTGKFAALTNFRDPHNIKSNAPTRGELVTDFLKQEISPQAYLETIKAKGQAYNGFNLLIGSMDELYWYSNYGKEIEKLSDGVYGLCNHLLDTPWPKVEKGKEALAMAVKKDENITFETLEAILQDKSLAPDEILPKTGLVYEREKALSSIFIDTEGYGTCSSGVLLVDYANNVSYKEITYTRDGKLAKSELFNFEIEKVVLH
jgi:uncharacterized protein with NRDE domain